MNSKVETGANCEGEIVGDNNSKLPSPSNPTCHMFTGDVVFHIWSEVAPLLEKAADWSRGEYEADDILVMVSEGLMQLWVFAEEEKVILVCVTQIITYPKRKICNIYALAGYRMDEMWNLFSQYGRVWLAQNGVEEIQTTCRQEIADKVRPLGFVPLVQVLRFDVKEIL